MKITCVKEAPFNHSSTKPTAGPPQAPAPDLLLLKLANKKPPRRKSKNSATGVRLRKDGSTAAGGGAKRTTRPQTPLLRWKFDEAYVNSGCNEQSENTAPPEADRKFGRKVRTSVSSRKLAASLWRMQLPEGPPDGGENLGFQSGVGDEAVPFHGHHSCKAHINLSTERVQSPRSVSGPINKLLTKVEPSFQYPISAMEGATKWDPINWKTSDNAEEVYGQQKLDVQQERVASVISSLELELEQARNRIHELETERRSSKKKLEHFLRKLSEERAAWRSREHEKVRAIIDDMKSDLNRERKNRQRMEIVNSKLVNELADTKLSAKRYMQDYEKERRSRELIEEVCDELAKEIGEDKAEIEELKRESVTFREEVEEERRMLQMAEVWREERVQMKLVDAKVILEDKFAQMNMLIADLENFLHSNGAASGSQEIKKAEILRQAAASINIQEIRDFTYEPPNPNDIFSVFEDVNYCDTNERQIEPCVADSPASRGSKILTVSPEANRFNKFNTQRHPNLYADQSGELEEDESDWETVSHLEDQGSSCSPGGSNPSVHRSHRDSNVSRSGSEWERNRGEGTPVTEISEVCSVPSRQLKKNSSISRLWRTVPGNGENYKIISLEGVNGRLSNGAIYSPDCGSCKGGLSPPELVGQWSSPESGNPHMPRGMKGCIEWPRSAQKNSLKAKLLEARMESQKIQLRQVLKQKI